MNTIPKTVILAAWLAGTSSNFAGLAAYDAKIASDHNGALPYTAISADSLDFDTTNSSAFDFGAVSGASTVEFIVHGDPVNGGPNGFLAVGSNDTRSLRYEQWNDTGQLGFTQSGVSDFLFLPNDAPSVSSPTDLTHVTFRWDQDTSTMELYINGILNGVNSTATGFEMPSGMGTLGNSGALNAGMSGIIERVTVYDEAVASDTIAAHADAWNGPGGSLANYDETIATDHAGALPYTAVSTTTLTFDTTNSEAFDFGTITASATIEFIVSGDPEAGGTNGWLAVGANSTWSVRYEQWNNTSELGFTHAGVSDYRFSPTTDIDTSKIESPTEPTHVTYRWDDATTTMELFINGAHVATRTAPASFEMPTGPGSLGNNAALTEGMLGVIDRVTVYNDAISPADILAHANAWLEPDEVHLAVSSSNGMLTFTWTNRPGKVYDLLSETDLTTNPATWPVYDGHTEMTGDTLIIPLPPGESQLFFALLEKDAPPLFSDDFENGLGDWTAGTDGDGGTAWELGTPSIVGPSAANSGTNCFGTNLAANYTPNANVWLRSPAIDLTGITEAKLKFAHFKDIEAGFDFGSVRVLDAVTNEPLGTDIATTIDGIGTTWEPFSARLPAEALGQMIKIEFQFVSETLNEQAGWYIDDVELFVK